MQSLDKVSLHVNARNPEIVIPLAGLGAPLVTFFAVPILFALLGFLVLDLVTGLTKASIAKRISSQNFGMLFERMSLYIVIFITMHSLTVFTPAPFSAYSQLLENFILTGLLLKEALSILENVKAIGTLRGWDMPALDVVIDKLGLDLDHILKDVQKLPTPKLETKPTDEPKAVAGSEDAVENVEPTP